MPTFNATKARPSGLCTTPSPILSSWNLEGLRHVDIACNTRSDPEAGRTHGHVGVPMLHETVLHLVVHYLASSHRSEAHVVQAPSGLDSGRAIRRGRPALIDARQSHASEVNHSSVPHCATRKHARKRGQTFRTGQRWTTKIAQGSYEDIVSSETLSSQGTNALFHLVQTASAEGILYHKLDNWYKHRVCCPHRTTYPRTCSPPKTTIPSMFRSNQRDM